MGLEMINFLEFSMKLPRKIRGKGLAFGGVRSPPPIDVEDMEVNPLHAIFNLKGVLVGKELNGEIT
jgi:hypothetical protein